MRLLVVIPHFFRAIDPQATNRSHRGDARDERLRALIATVAALHQAFLQHSINRRPQFGPFRFPKAG